MDNNVLAEQDEGVDPIAARNQLQGKLRQLQTKIAALVILKAKDARQDQLASLRAESESVVDDIRILDEIIALVPLVSEEKPPSFKVCKNKIKGYLTK